VRHIAVSADATQYGGVMGTIEYMAPEGTTASAQVKPATLETGLVIQVPPFVNEGDKVRVNTETGEYQSRV
jgi:Elongation factor P, C-terminal